MNKIYETLEKVKKPDGIYFDHIDTTRGYWCTGNGFNLSCIEYIRVVVRTLKTWTLRISTLKF